MTRLDTSLPKEPNSPPDSVELAPTANAFPGPDKRAQLNKHFPSCSTFSFSGSEAGAKIYTSWNSWELLIVPGYHIFPAGKANKSYQHELIPNSVN